MTDKTVLVTDFTWPAPDIEVAVLKEVNAKLLLAPSSDESTLIELVAQADAILTCFAHVTESVIRAGNKLQVIGRYGIGVDNIDVSTATSLEIPVTYVPAYCVDEVAEHTLGFVLSLARKIALYDHAVRQGSWNLQDGLPIHRVRGKTLGLIGLGLIGSAVAKRAIGFDMNVIYYSRTRKIEYEEKYGITWVSDLGELLESSDYVSVHIPLGLDTQNFIGKEELSRMNENAFLINTSRGGTVDPDALAEALQAGKIAGAGLDVTVPEPIDPDHPLVHMDNVIITPHIASASAATFTRMGLMAADNVINFLQGESMPACLNPEVLPSD